MANFPILLAILGGIYVMTGLMKLAVPYPKLADMMGVFKDYSAGFVKFIGMSEFLGGVGLLAVYFGMIPPIVAAIAAIGLAVIMIGAINAHFRHKEYMLAIPALILLVLDVYIAGSYFI